MVAIVTRDGDIVLAVSDLVSENLFNSGSGLPFVADLDNVLTDNIHQAFGVNDNLLLEPVEDVVFDGQAEF